MERIYDYVILGGGIGGLAIGSLLAKEDKSICLIEANNKLGGHAYTIEIGKYKFSHDIHYIMGCQEGGPINKFLKKIGLNSKIEFNEFDSKCYDLINVNGRKVYVPLGIDNYLKVLIDLYPKYKIPLKEYFELEKKIIYASRKINRAIKKTTILKNPLSFLTILKYLNYTLEDILNKFNFPLELRAILAGRIGNLSACPKEVSFLMYAAMDIGYSESASYPKKGVQYLIEEITKVISKKINCKIFTKVKAEEIIMENNRIKSIKTNKDEIIGKNFISNLDPAETFKMIKNLEIPSSYKKKLNYQYSDSVICIYLGLKGIDLKEHGFKRGNIWHHSDMDLNREYLREIEENDFSKPWLFISAPSLSTDKGVLCPKNHETLEILTFANYDYFKGLFEKDKIKYRKKIKEIYDKILDIVDKNYLPNIRKYIDKSIVHTPLDMGEILNAPYGNVYGARLTPELLIKHRITNTTPIKNLYLVGASSSYPGIMGVIKGVLNLFNELGY